MTLDERVRKAVSKAVVTINSQVDEAYRIEDSPSTVLLGEGSQLDSLGLVSLVVATQQRLRQEFDVTIELVDSQAMDNRQTYFGTLGAFCRQISRRLEKQGISLE